MNTRLEKLTAKVAAVNMANEYANKLKVLLKEKFKPLVGQKVIKTDGSLLAKYADLVPKLLCNNDLHVYRLDSLYSLGWVVKSCASMPPHGCMYHETTVYIAKLDGQSISIF